VKSGYGLSGESELALLEDINSLASPLLPRLFPTLLATHSIPPEVTSPEQRAAWVEQIAKKLIPEVRRRGLASRVDVFVERSAYTTDETRLIAAAARANGLALHLHVDQLTDGGGAALAAELGAQAVSHLERVSQEGITALARSAAIAVLLPTATIAAAEPRYAPARALIDAGVRLALATNLNPGTAPTESTSLMFFLAAVGLHLTPAEILWACTRGGALALGALDLGLLEETGPADLVLWNAYDLAHLPYHAGVNHVAQAWRGGQLVVDRSAEADHACDGHL
jgi:imidazolonepropionase